MGHRKTKAAEWNGYKVRLEVLRRNGFKSYKQYLASDLWKSIRARVLERDEFKCKVCERKASQVHHLSYGDVTIRGERLDKMEAVCGRCHLRLEMKRGTKTPFLGPSKGAGQIVRESNALKVNEEYRLRSAFGWLEQVVTEKV